MPLLQKSLRVPLVYLPRLILLFPSKWRLCCCGKHRFYRHRIFDRYWAICI